MCKQKEKTLDPLYSTHRDAYKALPRPPFGKSDDNSILLIPAYKLKLKQEATVTRSIKKWYRTLCWHRLENVPGFLQLH